MLYFGIAQLEPKLKTAVILYYFNGLSTKELAAAMGCLEGTVKSRLYTARRKLKNYMESIDSHGKEYAKNGKYKVAQ